MRRVNRKIADSTRKQRVFFSRYLAANYDGWVFSLDASFGLLATHGLTLLLSGALVDAVGALKNAAEYPPTRKLIERCAIIYIYINICIYTSI